VASSYENHESIFEDFFRIKSAGSPNYRGSVFLLPEFTPAVCLLAFLPGATFSPPVKKRPNTKSQQAQILGSSIHYRVSSIVNPESRIQYRESRIENPFIYVPIRPLYICRGFSTNHLLFMQNKPNFQKAQMNANVFITKDYENKSNWTLGQNKPNSNPIKPNFKKAKMNVNLYVIEDYRKKDDFLVRINKPNFRNGQVERKFNFNKGLQKKRLFSSTKNKPNSNPNKPNHQKGKIDATCVFTMVYRKKDDFLVLINKPNFRNGQDERKLTYNKGLQKKRLFSTPKNKPNSNPNKPNLETAPGQAGLNIMAQISRGQNLLAVGYVAWLINKLLFGLSSAVCRLCSRIKSIISGLLIMPTSFPCFDTTGTLLK